MKTRGRYYVLCLLAATMQLIPLRLTGQQQSDGYPATVGENVMRIMILNRTAEPLSSMKVRFAQSQPPWFRGGSERVFELAAARGANLDLPFEVTSVGSVNEQVELDVLKLEQLLGRIQVKIETGGVLGKKAETGSIKEIAHEVGVRSSEPAIPTQYTLEQNYPNPFNPSTVIRYGLPEASSVVLEVYDPLGRVVRTLTRDMKAAGVHAVSWDGRNDRGELLPSGVYIYRLKTTGSTHTRKMLLVR